MVKKILCIGSVTADIILCKVDALPKAGSLQAVDQITMHVGGCAANAALDLVKLGSPVQLCCKLGKDSFGDYVGSKLITAGLDTRGIISDSRVSTTVSSVLVNSQGERSFLYSPGSTAKLTAQDIPESLVDGSDIIFIAGAMLTSAFDGIPCANFLRRCQANGKTTIMDTAWDYENIWAKKIDAAWQYLDWFMPSYEEALRLSQKETPEEIAAFFHEQKVRNVIVKLGSKGAFFSEDSGAQYYLPTYSGVYPVDTTGAGDAFCAGFLAGLAQGWTPKQSGQLANAVGTHCIMKVGASTGVLSLAEILSFMEKRKEPQNEH